RSAPTLADADHADDVRRVVQTGGVVVFERDRAEEAVVTREVVLDQVGLVVAVEEAVVGVRTTGSGAALRGRDPRRVGPAGAEAAERHPDVVDELAAAKLGIGTLQVQAD